MLNREELTKNLQTENQSLPLAVFLVPKEVGTGAKLLPAKRRLLFTLINSTADEQKLTFLVPREEFRAQVTYSPGVGSPAYYSFIHQINTSQHQHVSACAEH